MRWEGLLPSNREGLRLACSSATLPRAVLRAPKPRHQVDVRACGSTGAGILMCLLRGSGRGRGGEC